MNNILCLGDFSSGKSSFLNMLLGVSILPEQLASTNLPVIKIHAGETAGIFVREKDQKYGRPIASWSKIPSDWSTFEYVELTVPNHPLLDKGLVLWDSPGVNSTNEQHIKHLEMFIQNYKNRFHSVFYFLHGNLQNTHIEFIKHWPAIQNKLSIVINIKEVRPESESRKIENQVKKDVRVRLGTIPVELLYFGDLYEEFADESDKKTKGYGDQQRIALWEDIAIDFETLKKKHEQTIIGDVIIDILKESAGNTVEIEDYKVLDIETLVELADQNDEKALNELIEKYLNIDNYIAAFPWLLKSAELGNVDNQNNLAWCFHNGAGVKTNYSEAFNWIKKSAESGNSIGEYRLGICYELGDGVEQDYSKAFYWYQKSAEQGDSGAENKLGEYYKMGYGVTQDYAQAFRWFKKSADKGNVFGEFNIGKCYEEGLGIKQDNAEAFKWYNILAEQGDSDGEYLLGKCYQNGVGVAININKALEWYIKSANKKNSSAECQLGYCYFKGIGVIQNYGESFNWYKKSAQQGEPIAQNNLGWCYETGNGVTQDYNEAFKWYKQSAELGNSYGEYSLAMCYEKGIGVTKNINESLVWFTKSANQGNESAQKYLQESFEEVEEGFDQVSDQNLQTPAIIDEKVKDSLGIIWIFVEGMNLPFYIASTPVTFDQYDSYCKITNREKVPDDGWGRGNRPVINVNVTDAVTFCEWLSKEIGTTVRLPEEDEWEFAAKGGLKSKGFIYSGSNDLDAVGWFDGNSRNGWFSQGKTFPCCQKKPNELGIYDMSGNVWEMCGTLGVIRGGGWMEKEYECRVNHRFQNNPDNKGGRLGFRIIKEK